MILIVSFVDNAHVHRVLDHLRRPYVILDTSWFPAALRLNARFDASIEALDITLPDGRAMDLRELGAVWFRRTRGLTLHEEVRQETARAFAWSESNEALLGLWYSLECFWMNPPVADEVSQRKLRQLQLARRVGLSIPETLITNDPDAGREFVLAGGPGNVVRKAFRILAEAPRETRVVVEDDLRVIDAVKYAPVIFQRYVPAALDLRVTVVDGDVFAAAIRSEPDHHADYRMGLGSADVFPFDLPDDVANHLRALMDAFGLAYGAIDLRLTPEGEYVFLEVNPAGEYLFISDRTDLPIPAAIAASLARHDLEA